MARHLCLVALATVVIATVLRPYKTAGQPLTMRQGTRIRRWALLMLAAVCAVGKPLQLRPLFADGHASVKDWC